MLRAVAYTTIEAKLVDLLNEESFVEAKSYPHLWVDCFNLTENEVFWLEKTFNIPAPKLMRPLGKEKPRIDVEPEHSSISFSLPVFDGEKLKVTFFSFMLLKNALITFHDENIQLLEIQNFLLDADMGKSLRHRGVDFLSYRILLEISEKFNGILKDIENKLDLLEDEIIEDPQKDVMNRIFKYKKMLVLFRHVLRDNQEVVGLIEKGYAPQIKGGNLTYFGELYNRFIHMLDLEESYEDVLTSSLDVYLSSLSTRLNEAVRKLTVLATLLLLPAVVAGIYGMNFRFIPELEWYYGYPFALGLMGFLILLMLVYFKKLKWI